MALRKLQRFMSSYCPALLCSKDGSSDFCGFTKQSPRLSCVRGTPMKAAGGRCGCYSSPALGRPEFSSEIGVTLHNLCLLSNFFFLSLQASCVPLGGGERSCVCSEGYFGDGMTCYGDILKVSEYQRSEDFLRLERTGSALSLLFPVTWVGSFYQHQCEAQVHSKDTWVVPGLITANETIISKLLHPCAGSTCPVQ